MMVTDNEAQRAMAAAYSRLKIVLEPGGAVALAAALYSMLPGLRRELLRGGVRA